MNDRRRGWDMPEGDGARFGDSRDSSDGNRGRNNNNNNNNKRPGFGDDYRNAPRDKYQRVDEPLFKENKDVLHVRGHAPKRKPSDKEIENNRKSLSGNMSFEEEG